MTRPCNDSDHEMFSVIKVQTHLGKVLAEGSYVLGREACQQIVVQAVQLSLDILRQLNVHLRSGQMYLDHPPEHRTPCHVCCYRVQGQSCVITGSKQHMCTGDSALVKRLLHQP